MAKEDQESMPLLPARYHVFVKALEGAYVSLYKKRLLFLDRRKSYKLPDGNVVVTFELANCQRCGQEYIVGLTKDEKLEHADADVDIEGMNRRKPEFYMLSKPEEAMHTISVDDDELIVVGSDKAKEIIPMNIFCVLLAVILNRLEKNDKQIVAIFPKRNI